MKTALLLVGTALLACSSVWAIAQDTPESLLPPGFDKPKVPRPASAVAKPAAKAGPAKPATPPSDNTASAVVQPLPNDYVAAASAPKVATLPSGARIPTLKELEAMTPDQLDELLGLKPKNDLAGAARRSLERIGLLAEDEGGLPAGSLAGQNPQLVQALLTRNKGPVVSRWGHILLRQALSSRLDAPNSGDPADFAAQRAALLVRMGEGEAARALVQDIDPGNYTPELTQAAMDAYAATADVTGICPIVAAQGGLRKDADWRVLRAICSVFQGDTGGMAQLDRMQGGGVWPKIDMLLAQKYAGAAGKFRRAVTIEWDGVSEMTPWRYALAIGVGLEPPVALMKDAAPRYRYTAATAPMLPLVSRAAAADLAGGAGVLSSAAMVDLYSQIYAQDDISGDWSERADTLRTAYTGVTPADRLSAMRQLWDGAVDPLQRYSRLVLTAYAAARMPVSGEFADSAPDLIASMLAAGLDNNALRWAGKVDEGSLGWAMLALAAPQRSGTVGSGALNTFYQNDSSSGYRKSRFLLAGLAGLDRVDRAASGDFAAKLGVDPARQTRWTRLIDQAAEVNNQALVVLLAGAGMQGDSWEKMTSVNLFHIVAALNKVGLKPQARMIAAEAVARG